jgi:hypothetical protein
VKQSRAQQILHSAFALDRRGKEADAILLYQQALRLRLVRTEQRDAMICLASSLRTVRKLKPALATLLKANQLFPDDPVIRLFTALVQHDLGQKTSALRLIGTMYLQQVRNRRIDPYRNVLLRKFRSL